MMQQRKSGRPDGTDGNDFSYRMVVDSRYSKVAKGKSRLCKLISIQAVLQLIGIVCVVLPIANDKGVNRLDVSASGMGLLSLLIGDLGRRRSRSGVLRGYIIISSLAFLLSIFSAIDSSSALEVIQNLSDWERRKFELVKTFVLLVGSPMQIFTISTVISLAGNVSPQEGFLTVSCNINFTRILRGLSSIFCLSSLFGIGLYLFYYRKCVI